MSPGRFQGMVKQQYQVSTSSLARMARQMLELRRFLLLQLSVSHDRLLPIKQQGQFAAIVPALERRQKSLGDLAAVSQFDQLVVGIKQCAKIQRNAQDGIVASVAGDKLQANGWDSGLDAERPVDPIDPSLKAKQDFMRKILKLGRGSQGRECASAASGPITRKQGELVPSDQDERERSHVSKSRRRQGREQAERVFAADEPEIQTGVHHHAGEKCVVGETEVSEKQKEKMHREKCKKPGRRWADRWQARQGAVPFTRSELNNFGVKGKGRGPEAGLPRGTSEEEVGEETFSSIKATRDATPAPNHEAAGPRSGDSSQIGASRSLPVARELAAAAKSQQQQAILISKRERLIIDIQGSVSIVGSPKLRSPWRVSEGDFMAELLEEDGPLLSKASALAALMRLPTSAAAWPPAPTVEDVVDADVER